MTPIDESWYVDKEYIQIYLFFVRDQDKNEFTQIDLVLNVDKINSVHKVFMEQEHNKNNMNF